MNSIRQVYVINLDRRPDRFQEFQDRCSFSDQVIRFPAYDGKYLSETKDPFILQKLSKLKSVNPFEVGCSLSHYRVYQNIIESKLSETDQVLVFEDDVHFNPSFVKVINQIPKLDFVYLGGRFRRDFDVPDKSYWKKISDHVYQRPSNLSGHAWDRTTHAYILNKRMARKLINLLKDNLFTKPFDGKLLELHRYMTFYETLPHLCYSPINYKSDIQAVSSTRLFIKDMKEFSKIKEI